ncbi:MAG: AMP-binding protein, partial [Candidatus Eisenbacteria bacterium]|nr:AMP-binding protein [Candidatus Eisenbacteria bacterium]
MILVTGATGFVGTRVIRELLHLRLPIAAVVRTPPDEAAARLTRAWWDWPDLAALIGTAVHPCAGDLTKPGLGLSPADAALLRDTSHVVHVAADIRLQAPLEELRGVNRDGTGRVLELARSFRSLQRVLHVSTAYVAGNRPGSVGEQDLSAEFGFRNGYELSKFEGEQLVRGAMASLPATVVRPGMVVGDSVTGAVATFNTFYLPVRLYLQRRLHLAPVSPSLRLPLVPVDYVARSIAVLLTDPRAAGSTVHLVPPHEASPTVSALVDAVRGWALHHLDVRLPRPLFLPIPVPRRLRTFRAGHSPGGTLWALLPYSFGLRLQRENADRLLGPYGHDWRTMLPALLSYAVARGFMHRAERTVHEQVAFRLSRSSRPIRYHDIVDGKVETLPASHVAAAIRAAGRSLHALGVRKGDRVSIVGPNCSRYLAIDVALGLAGAVSVPLYPTTPPAELHRLIAAAEARLAFVCGDAADALCVNAGVRIVSFGRDPPLNPGVMAWDAFLKAGEGTAGFSCLV